MIREQKSHFPASTTNCRGKDEYWTRLDHYVRRINGARKKIRGALVTGIRGTGKTFFVEQYLQGFESSHPILIARHHQQHKEIPYFGFKYGISDYLSKVYKVFSKERFQDFSSKLKARLGENFPLLLDYIPELSLLAGKDPAIASRSIPTVENQLYPLFKIFFEFLADYYKRPVFFFTDDLQWIDGSGVNLLKYLLINLPSKKLVWIGSCRTPQEKVCPITQLTETLRFEKKYIENIHLKGLNLEQTQHFVASMLGSPASNTLAAACFQLSDGNPMHLQIMLESAKTNGLIWHVNHLWHGDIERIRNTYKDQNTRNLFLERLNLLTETARDMLCIIACIGRFSYRTLLDWLDGDEKLLRKIIKETKAANLLEEKDNNIRFSEMHFNEMIYNDMSVKRRSELHYTIAKLLYARGFEQLNGTRIILMTTHFNQSLEQVMANNELQLCAELNYQAGFYSKQDNAFDQARYFYKMSADLFKECSWKETAEQVWLVYMERARTEYFLGEYDLAEIHLDFLLERFHDPLKRASAFELKIIINNHLGRYRKVTHILKEILAELGLELPLDEGVLKREVMALKTILESGHKHPKNTGFDAATHKAILNLLYVGGMALHHTSDVLMTWAALQIIIRTEDDADSGVKAIGCVSYARMLIIAGDIEKGADYGMRGIEINKSHEDLTLRCRVYGVYAFYIQPWQRAFSESMPFLKEGIQAGKKTGDLIGLYILKTHQLNLHFISGLPLKGLLSYDFEETYPGMELTYYITHYQKSLVNFLLGITPVFSIPRQQPPWLAARLTILEEKFYRNYVWARYYFLFGHYELAEIAAREANANKKLQEGSPLVPANMAIWFLAISQNWQNYQQDKEDLESRMAEILKEFSFWKKHAPLNYEAPWWLLNAEWSRIKGDEERALTCYRGSIEAAGENLSHLGLTYELLARFLLGKPEKMYKAVKYLKKAIKLYEEWGAAAKVAQLLQQYHAVLYDEFPDANDIDFETIQHELSGDMEVTSLVKKLMVLLLRISGSTRVVVELINENNDLSNYSTLSVLNVDDTSIIPTAMLLMSRRSKNPVIVNDLSTDNGFREVELLRKCGVNSFLILPVTINGQLSMVIYLENKFVKNWYQHTRLKGIRIAANQGAVIIDNAKTHEKTVKLNEEIRREMGEKERLASLIEAQKDAHLQDLVEAQENERNRIASDLHDSLGSLLSSIKLRFNGLQEHVDYAIPQKAGLYNNAVKLLDEAVHELRRIAHNMSPVSLRRFGLKAAIQTFVEQINASGQLQADLQVLGLDRRLPENLEVAVYRICQELVQNVIKHAKTDHMRVQLIAHQDSLNIIVEDNGVGMNKKHIGNGFGFNTIQSKASLFKGSFSIESRPGKGTMVLVDLPL